MAEPPGGRRRPQIVDNVFLADESDFHTESEGEIVVEIKRSKGIVYKIVRNWTNIEDALASCKSEPEGPPLLHWGNHRSLNDADVRSIRCSVNGCHFAARLVEDLSDGKVVYEERDDEHYEDDNHNHPIDEDSNSDNEEDDIFKRNEKEKYELDFWYLP
jgi:hypothetical protein